MFVLCMAGMQGRFAQFCKENLRGFLAQKCVCYAILKIAFF